MKLKVDKDRIDYNKFYRNNYHNMLSKDEMIAHHQKATNTFKIILAIFYIGLIIVASIGVYLTTTQQNDFTNTIIDRTELLSTALCKTQGEKYMGYDLITSGAIQINCDKSLVVLKKSNIK